MPAIAQIIDRATVTAVDGSARLRLFVRSNAEGDALYVRLTGEEGAGFETSRSQLLELTVEKKARAWRSVEAAFTAAREIAATYDLPACEADVAVGVMPEDPGRASERGVEESADMLTFGCWTPEEPDLESNKRWAVTAVKADKAWVFAAARGRPSRGEGIVIAQPDTGVTAHAELAGVPYSAPRNLLGDGSSPADPTDPMQGGGNPGHGTGTASVLVSREPLDVIGTAPLATLMPIRAIETVVQPSMVRVAEAVDHAVAHGAHVITMSLGGLWSLSLWRAIERAIAADVIVMAAAGNCVSVVVWPAQFDSCLAVAGVDQHFAPWRGTSKGPAVDISAPAQNVYRANAKTNSIGQGQGTSFAVALTAGVAACWLAYRGRGDVITAARQRNETLQAMFRRLVRATAYRPSGSWDESSMGPGIIDAEALLKADFDLGRETEGPIRVAVPRDPTYSLRALAIERFGEAALSRDFDWVGHGGEISLALLRDSAQPDVLRPAPTAPAVVRLPGAESDHPAKVRRLRNQILASESLAGGAALESVRSLESTGGGTLTPQMADNILDRVSRRARDEAERRDVDPEAVAAALAMLQVHGSRAMAKLAAAAADLSRDERASLEAIVIADGSRPSFLLADGAPPLQDPYMGNWDRMIGPLQARIAELAHSVGRIQPTNGHNGYFVGTGVLVDREKGIVLTNYHVLDDAQKKFLVPMQRTNSDTIRVLGGLEIDFIGEADSFSTNKFKIVEAKLHATSGRGFAVLDAVTLKIEAIDASSRMPTAVVAFSANKADFAAAAGQDLCTIGYPGPPVVDSDPSGKVNWDFVMKTLFGGLFGVKRLAPGRVIRPPGSVERDRVKTFGHDATTFGGASGSAIFAWGVGTQPAIGLHFAGDTEISNYAITASIVAEQFRALGVPI
jgi:serine protease